MGKLRSVGVPTEGIFVFVPVQGWRAWGLRRKGWRKQPTRARQACELGVWRGCGRGTGLLCAGSELVVPGSTGTGLDGLGLLSLPRTCGVAEH